MAMKSGNLDYWRNYFRSANSDIFDIIEHAIIVAASDCPKEFRLQRDRIAERLFSCKLTRCTGCDRVELAVPGGNEDEGCKSDFDVDGCEFEAGGSKESKVNSSRDDQGEMNMNQLSNFSYGEAEALTDEIEEVGQIVGEVLRIKEIFYNSEEESDSVLYDSLRKLQLMALTVDTLKATEIGKAVNGLRKHGSKQIRHLARTLIEGWKDLVDEWVNATAAIAATEGTPDSLNPSVLDEEEGLPSPPMDEGAFFATQTTSMELSQFFDGMDDDGNPRNSGEFIKNHDNGRKSSLEHRSVPKRQQQPPNEVNVLAKSSLEHQTVPKRQQQPLDEVNVLSKDKIHQIKKQEAVVKPNKPPNSESGSVRPPKLSAGQRVNHEMKYQQKSDKVAIQRRPLAGPQDKLKCSDGVSEVKLEAAKRKLQERYQQAENAKKQRTIQVMELQDLPKQGLGHRNPHVKHGNHNRHWTNGRR
ncbi:hypothetical protein L1049_008753 [Liquidambar formosana]|uniref:TFIIS N-terminal domain-containing protein n=1 Tax=Liquidambar formosana TaxID=63359 RepID=A0AAP0S9W7_LIQFO